MVSINAAYEKIGPQEAAALLASNENPRGKHPPGRVEAYARAMESGRWKPSSVILVGPEGQLLDGFGRLLAVQLCGRPQHFIVIRGFPSDQVDIVDANKVRDPAALLRCETSENPRMARALVAGIVRLPHRQSRVLLNSDYPILFSTFRKALEAVLSVTRPQKRGQVPVASKTAFCRAIIAGESVEKIQTALRKIEEVDVSDAPSLRLLVKALQGTVGAAGATSSDTTYLRSARAIRAWLDGVALGVLRADGDDPFPLNQEVVWRTIGRKD
jgi:hypothetical protein